VRKYSQGTVRRDLRKDGTWKWEAVIAWTENGKRGTLRKVTPYACEPRDPGQKPIKGHSETPKGKNSRLALTFLRKWRDELIAAQKAEAETAAQKAKSMHVIELVDEYWASLDIEQVTRDGYAKLRKHLDVPELDCAASELRPADVQKWLDAETERDVSVQLQRKSLTQLKSAYRWAVRTKMLESNPCDPIDLPPIRKRDPNPLDHDDLDRMLTALDTFEKSSEACRCLADIARLSLLTGMRASELCSLKWESVDGALDDTMAAGGKIHVLTTISVPKGGSYIKTYPRCRKRRDITMDQQVVDVLTARRKLFEPFVDDLKDCFVLAYPSKPTQFTHPHTMGKMWGTFVATVGLLGVDKRPPNMDDLRDTFAVNALHAKADLVTVSRGLGTDVQTTLYCHVRALPSHMKAAMLAAE
jgi:integrase